MGSARHCDAEGRGNPEKGSPGLLLRLRLIAMTGCEEN